VIKPIDTQILHPQTPKIAEQQQRNNQLTIEQQAQFGDIMKKEVEHKKETVISPQRSENLKTDEEGSKESPNHNKKHSKRKNKAQKNKSKKKDKNPSTTIDIRI